MSTEENLCVLARFDEIVDARDADRLVEVCTPDMVNHAIAPDRPAGLAGSQEFLRTQARLLQADGWTELHTVANGDLVVQFGARGGHWGGGSFRGYELQEGDYQRDFVAMYRFEGGRIAERWAVRDDLAMVEQLGGIPSR
jgi:ketosteroid isomerase-like protein